jgi:hypothetical protein
MKRYSILTVVFVLSVTFVLVGCRSEPESTTPAPATLAPATPSPMESPLEPPVEADAGEPPAQSVATSPLPTPAPEMEIVPGSDTGVVRGTVKQTGYSVLTVDQHTLHLAKIITDSQGTGFEVARMSPTTDPRSDINKDGSFLFTEVEPGKYALSTVTPRGESVLLLNLDTGRDIIIEVEDGEITDVGVIPVNFGF